LYFVFPVFWFCWVPKMFQSIDRFSISFQPFFISMDFYDYVYVIQFLIYSINHLLKIFYHWPIQLLSSVGAWQWDTIIIHIIYICGAGLITSISDLEEY
jgi:hypothetical protein